MTRFLIVAILMLIFGAATYFLLTAFTAFSYIITIPLAIFFGIIVGFFIYIQIDNRMGP